MDEKTQGIYFRLFNEIGIIDQTQPRLSRGAAAGRHGDARISR